MEVDEVDIEDQDANLKQVDEWAQQMEFKAICAPLELNDVNQTLWLEHVELRSVRAHVKERNLFVHDHFLSFLVEFYVLSNHTKKINRVPNFENLLTWDVGIIS